MSQSIEASDVLEFIEDVIKNEGLHTGQTIQTLITTIEDEYLESDSDEDPDQDPEEED